MYPDLSLKENITHGTKEHPIRAMHFTTGKSTPYPDHFFVSRHWHSYIEILHIVKGSYLFEINLQEYTLTEGTFCILNSGEPHQITGLTSDTIHDVILFTPEILDFSYEDEWEATSIAPFLTQTLSIKNILHPEDAGHSEILTTFNKSLAYALEQLPNWYPRCKLSLLELFLHITSHQLLLPTEKVLSAANTRKITHYKTIISYIEKHYQEPLSLRQLAELIPCNSQYLCRFFKEIAGVSVIQYLISYRLERACHLLLHTTESVTDIALNCGFENISYFIRKFREFTKETPKEYRSNHQIPKISAQTPSTR